MKIKVEIVQEILQSTSRDNAEIRCDLLEIKGLIKRIYFKERIVPVKLIEPSNCLNQSLGLPKADFYKNIRRYSKK